MLVTPSFVGDTVLAPGLIRQMRHAVAQEWVPSLEQLDLQLSHHPHANALPTAEIATGTPSS